jgi:hypothetical protein
MFYFNQFLHNISNVILIRSKELKLIICMFIKQISLKKLVIWIFLKHFIMIWNLVTTLDPCFHIGCPNYEFSFKIFFLGVQANWFFLQNDVM